MNPMLSREASNQVITVLINAAHEIVRHADVERAAWTACQDIDVVAKSEPIAGARMWS